MPVRVRGRARAGRAGSRARRPGARAPSSCGRYELYYNRNADIVACDDEIGESLLDVAYPKLTTLRVSAVRRLARGDSTTASGTAVTTPLNPRATSGETLRDTLKVKRVR